MSKRRLERAARTADRRRSKPVGGYVLEDDAVVCTRCGAMLPPYAGRHLKQIHDAVHRAETQGGGQ